MGKSDTSFSKDKQPKKRTPRSKGKKTLMLDAIRKVCKTEQAFLQQVVKAGLGDPEKEIPPNPVLLTLVLNRIEPPLKSVAPMVEFKFRKDAKPHDQANDVLDAVSKGLIAPDIGQMFIQSITSMLKIQEVTDIDERLKKMEEQIESSE